MHDPEARPTSSAGGKRAPHDARSTLSADRAAVRSIVDRLRSMPGALLPILHAIQDELGCIPPDAVPDVAAALNLSRAEVHGVITFYPHFRSEPGARHTLEVCRAESCQAMGGDALAGHARARLGCDFHAVSADGAFALEPVYCLGLCAQSPAVMIDGKPYARVTQARLDRLLDTARKASSTDEARA